MVSGHSKSAKITSNGNEGLKGLIEEKEGTYVVKARRSTGGITNLGTKESSQANKPTCSDHRHEFLVEGVFLSHSVEQKIFASQLKKDLKNLGVSCFCDEDRKCLPEGEDFASPIFTRLAVLLLSKEFLETKSSMVKLSTFVKARDKNPKLQILPLFFKIPPKALRLREDNEKWKELEKGEKTRDEWHKALETIRGINGLEFSEGGDEVKFRYKIVKEIWHKLRIPSQRYPVFCMQGELRMCQEVADFFNKVQPNEKEIRIAGLYGVAGEGKTTLGKALCNLKFGDFDGKVCHLEFSRGDRGDSFERIKFALQYLTNCPHSHLQTLTKYQAQAELYRRVKGQRVLLVLDNITKENIEEVRDYVQADVGKNSCILLSARSVDVLVKYFEIDSQSCMEVPRFEDDEGIRILLERTSLEESTLGAEDRIFARDIVRGARTFRRFVLKDFGGHLFSKYGSNLSDWVAEINGLVDRSGYGSDDTFALLGKHFDDMRPEYRTIFILLALYKPDMPSHKIIEWLAISFNEEMQFIIKAVEDLYEKGFVEAFEPEILIHDIYIGFAKRKAEEMGRWLWWKGDPPSTRGLISGDPAGFELAKLEQCIYRSPSQIAPRHLKNLLVLQLVGVRNMSKLALGAMDLLRSITLHDCKDLAELDEMENLLYLAWIQIRGVNSMMKLPELSNLIELRYVEIDISDSQVPNRLGDLSRCFHLREINVCCPSLLEFPRLNGLPFLKKVEFRLCDKVKGPLDCTECVELQSIVLHCQMAASPILNGCNAAVSWSGLPSVSVENF